MCGLGFCSYFWKERNSPNYYQWFSVVEQLWVGSRSVPLSFLKFPRFCRQHGNREWNGGPCQLVKIDGTETQVRSLLASTSCLWFLRFCPFGHLFGALGHGAIILIQSVYQENNQPKTTYLRQGETQCSPHCFCSPGCVQVTRVGQVGIRTPPKVRVSAA